MQNDWFEVKEDVDAVKVRTTIEGIRSILEVKDTLYIRKWSMSWWQVDADNLDDVVRMMEHDSLFED